MTTSIDFWSRIWYNIVMSLQYSTETYRVVTYHELERFINETLKPSTPFSIVADQEWGNDQYRIIQVDDRHPVLVDGKLEHRPGISEYEKKKVQQWLDTGQRAPFMLSAILNDLCAKSLIKPGTYLVDICW